MESWKTAVKLSSFPTSKEDTFYGWFYISDHVAKLHQAVFEEYYRKRMEDLKDEKAEIDTDKLIQEAKVSQVRFSHECTTIYRMQNCIPWTKSYGKNFIPQTESVNIFANDDVVDPFLCKSDLCKKTSSYKTCSCTLDVSESEETCQDDEFVVAHSLESGAAGIEDEGHEAAANSVQDEIVDRKSHGEDSSDVLEAPVVRVVRRPKCTSRTVSQAVKRSSDIGSLSDIALRLTNHHTTTDLTRASSKVVSVETKSKEEINTKRDAWNNVEIIEIIKRPNSSPSKKVPREMEKKVEKTRETLVQLKSKGEITFENWKKAKTNTYQQIIREEQKVKQLKQAAEARQMEKREAASQAYLYWRRQQDARQRRLINAKKRVLAHIESKKIQSNEKRSANSQAFKVWKRQKDIKLRERKTYMMAYGQQHTPEQQIKPQKPKPGAHIAFNMWLDQLDCVLHQKYLRERRYLVRSFYCQPAYFGTAALCTR
ncbi:uncharacterized protein LOC107224621 isoform X1 [Neodiprion lecontei]|uniref:Uncharacterized protein LOC107224621 isoform X1 n=1 Tax=Neodiprion lecontei TaxID=441921 RepID=A0ABM3FPH8_NEOLC|nr:uncharacterized protein LOC107224621 isoform X1 [Neodiprion lecontei]